MTISKILRYQKKNSKKINCNNNNLHMNTLHHKDNQLKNIKIISNLHH